MAAAARSLLGMTAIILLAGAIVMQFFIILSGLNDSPETQIYFLQADTSGIQSSSVNYHNPARWTYLAICGVDSNGHNANCSPKHAAIPFDPVRNFGTEQGVPDAFYNTHKYYYLSRFAWAFYLVALFFSVVAIFVSLLALCTRLGSYLAGMSTFLALFFQTVCAALMTAWTVEGRNHFRSAGLAAKLGVKAYAFTWAPWACFLIAGVLFCVGGGVSKNERTRSRREKRSYFGRKRSTRSRGSFIESESGRRAVKDDYE